MTARVAVEIATASSVAATLCGIFVSYWLDLPTGPTIVALLSVLFAVRYAYAALRKAVIDRRACSGDAY